MQAYCRANGDTVNVLREGHNMAIVSRVLANVGRAGTRRKCVSDQPQKGTQIAMRADIGVH